MLANFLAEQLLQHELDPAELEDRLINLWSNTYAYASNMEEESLKFVWLTRGRAVKIMYPEASLRRRIYKTSLAPQSAIRLLDLAETVKQELIGGMNYATLGTDEKINFIVRVITHLIQVPAFDFPVQLSNANNAPNWTKLLRWWLAKNTVSPQPNADKTSVWYQFIASNIIYKANWGIGSILSLLFDTTEDGIPVRPLEIDDWPRSGLPWIAFWLKELLSWARPGPGRK